MEKLIGPDRRNPVEFIQYLMGPSGTIETWILMASTKTGAN